MSNILRFCFKSYVLVTDLINQLTFLQPLERIHSILVIFFHHLHHLETGILLGIPEETAMIYITTQEISLDICNQNQAMKIVTCLFKL